MAFLSELGQKRLHKRLLNFLTDCNTENYICTRKLPEFSSNWF